ncbi:hypothetical protein BU25DRAFT_116223 [Macroventuria anomochaeta]|uniref:Uncharacterized protein n=1 Tax=Macroventuria anomochaeta TaxID=301207 RepID=A0ACB6RUZ5_9PLEO|nr:uncharacterized protein BU25DRAFT_116223 [Macroventuria anomochaeta]KAF2625594.1 hypothetical protein BU25DRAFT_116223 [Macroventuria anomochaeta]
MKGDTRSHQTTLGKQVETTSTGHEWVYNYVDEARAPFAEYPFKYRSRGKNAIHSAVSVFADYHRVAALQSLQIISRSPSLIHCTRGRRTT